MCDLHSPEFAHFFANSIGTPTKFQVYRLNPEEMELFQCRNPEVWLSRISLDAHKAKHPEVGLVDYRKIPEIIRQGYVWTGHRIRHYLFLHAGDNAYRAALKTDAQGHDVWFLSLILSKKQKPPKGAVRVR